MEETKEPTKSSETLHKPQDSDAFFYCCEDHTNKLHRVNLLTGEHSYHEVPSYQFKYDCCWSELPGGSLLITGGAIPPVSEVVMIDTLREWAVSALPPMHTPRSSHAAVYHSQYLYVLGGFDRRECERFVCAESRWEVLHALPVACKGMSAVELENSLFALGGWNRRDLDTVQKLSLLSLTWELMQLKLPHAICFFPCFKTETQVYLVIKETLYSFTPLQIKPIKSLPLENAISSSYYSRGTLYYEDGYFIGSLIVGELTSQQ